MTVHDLRDSIVMSRKLRPRTKVLYLAGVDDFVTFTRNDPRTWTASQVVAWRDAMVAEKLKNQSINVKLNALRFATRRLAEIANNTDLDFAHQADMLKPTKPTRRERRQREPLTRDQAARLLLACLASPGPIALRDSAILTLGLRMGLRSQTLADLKLIDVKLPKMTITLKGGHRRSISLDKKSAQVLAGWLNWLRAVPHITTGPVFRSLSRPRKKGPPTVRGGMTPDAVYKMVLKRTKAAGIRRHVHPDMLVARG